MSDYGTEVQQLQQVAGAYRQRAIAAMMDAAEDWAEPICAGGNAGVDMGYWWGVITGANAAGAWCVPAYLLMLHCDFRRTSTNDSRFGTAAIARHLAREGISQPEDSE